MMSGNDASYLVDILALLLATVIVVPFFHAIRLGALLGYLAAGVVLGPWGLGVITEVDKIRHLGEFGVIFLLFVLGMELKPDKLWRMRKMVLGLGAGQLILTAAAIYGVAIWLGVSDKSAIIIGFGLALSSTAFCLKLLAERGGISTLMGRMSFSVLLFQDLAVVPLLALVSYLANGGEGTIITEFSLLYGAAVIIGLLLMGRYLLNPILGRIVASQDPEVFIAVAVLLVLGVAWLMESIGLSMALGAFLAGLMLAESHYRHQIEADILPFRGILLGLFFMTVGMGVDFGLLWRHLGAIVGLTIGLMVIKGLVVYVLVRVSGARHDVAVQSGVLLSQSGEFGFVLFGVAGTLGLLELELSQILTLIIALTMVLTPFVVKGANVLLLKYYVPKPSDDGDYPVFMDDSEAHVILAGFGRVGARVGALLGEAGVSYIALDMKQERVKVARGQGFPVFFGDASQVKVLQAAGAERAKMLVIALEEPDKVDRLVLLTKQAYPNMIIHARARDRQHCADLISQGATTTVSETLEISLRLTEETLLGNGVDRAEVTRVINEFRDDYYLDVVKKMSENKVVMGELRH
jgi:monovalent cation:proton antiporter-2 (CPA2) family protein